jgi:hypothetical protein
MTFIDAEHGNEESYENVFMGNVFMRAEGPAVHPAQGNALRKKAK